ncbi:hypothetical protein V8J88_18780 [Massilia sp. W12]|uniref:hypothetical protein n=1 Tax=Massilia sp. W12 TaxID=3126507 RepID=UPI0030CA60BC
MDQQKLRSLVLEKTGIKIDLNDPAFALVVMNEAILDEAVARHLGLLEQAGRNLLAHPALQSAPHAAQPAAARHDDIWEEGAPRQPVAPPLSAAAPEVAPATAPAQSAPPAAAAPRNAPAASLPWPQMAISAALAALFTLAGQALFMRQPAAPAALSEQQQKQVQDAEKWQKVLPQLDAKTRQQVEEALRKL